MSESENIKREVCMISIAFPTDNDESALTVKRKIDEMLSGIADSRIEFRLTNANVKPSASH